jgi:hypothetical protein
MPRQLESPVTRREFLVGAGCVAATGYLVVGETSSAAAVRTSPTSPTTTPDHTVVIDVVTNPSTVSYTNKPPQPDPPNLHVKGNETVTWEAKTSKTHHHSFIVFIAKTPFIDGSGNPIFVFHGSEGDETTGIGINAKIDPKINSGTFKYLVVVFDKDKAKPYFDDPKIIIGDGDNAKTELTLANEHLRKAVLLDSTLEDKIDPIEENLQKILNSLK